MQKIELTQGKVALVDNEDYDELSKHDWELLSKPSKDYHRAARREGTRWIYMHRQIMDAPDDMVVDHINHDPLDNRKENLRVCTHRQNICNREGLQRNNTSGCVGVTRYSYERFPGDVRWVSQLKSNGEMYFFGIWHDKRKAALIRDLWACDLHGVEYAFTNFEVVSFGGAND